MNQLRVIITWLVLTSVLLLSGCSGAALARVDQQLTQPLAIVTADNALPTDTLAADTSAGVSFEDIIVAGGGHNNVRLINQQNQVMRVKAKVQLNRIPGPTVAPVNLALARSSGTGVRSFVVALQINVYQRGASAVAPQNAAVAVNVNCTRCVTVAHALQYTLPVDDIQNVPDDVKQLITTMNQELNEIERLAQTGQITASEANARILTAISQFKALAANLDQQLDEATETTSPESTAALN